MEIESVTVQGFKCFKSARSLSLTGGLNCLQGSNGAGKTSSIEAICCLFGMTGRQQLRYTKLHQLVNQESLASDPKAAAHLKMKLRDTSSMQTGQLSTTLVECTIDSNSIKFRLNGKHISKGKYTAFLRKAFGGFEQPCFFIQQSKATALAAASPAALWTYLQETTGERLVCSMESQWLALRPKLKSKYFNVVERIAELKDTRAQGQLYLGVVERLAWLQTDRDKARHELSLLECSILQQELCCGRRKLRALEEQLGGAHTDQQAREDTLAAATAALADAHDRKQERSKESAAAVKESLAMQKQVSTCETVLASLHAAAAAARQKRRELVATLKRLAAEELQKKAELAKVGAKIAFLTNLAGQPDSCADGADGAAQLQAQAASLQDSIAAAQLQVKDALAEQTAAQAAVNKLRRSLDVLATDIQEKRGLPNGVRETTIGDVAKQLQQLERQCTHAAQQLDDTTKQLQSSEYHFITRARLQSDDVKRKAGQLTGWSSNNYAGPLLLAVTLKPEAKRYLTAVANFMEPLWGVHLATGLNAMEVVSRACAGVARLWNTAKFSRRGPNAYAVPPGFAGSVVDPRSLVSFPNRLRNVVDHIFQGMLIADTDEVAALLLKQHRIASVTLHGNVSRAGEFTGGYRVESSQSVTSRVFAYHSLTTKLAALELGLTTRKSDCVAHASMLALLQQQKKRRQLLRTAELTRDEATSAHDALRVHVAQLQGTLDACLRHHAAVSTTTESTMSTMVATGRQTLQAMLLEKKQVALELSRLQYQLEELRSTGEDSDSVRNNVRKSSSSGSSSSTTTSGSGSSSSTAAKLRECVQQLAAARQQRDRAQQHLEVCELQETQAQDEQAALKSSAELRQTQLREATATLAALQQQTDSARKTVADHCKRLRTLHEDTDADVVREPVEPLMKAAQAMTRNVDSLDSQIEDADEQVLQLAPLFGKTDRSVLSAEVDRVGRDLEQLQGHVETIRVAMRCLEDQIHKAKTSLSRDTKRACVCLQANFQKIAGALLPKYGVCLEPVGDDGVVVGGVDSEDVVGIKFKTANGGTSELSGGQKTMLGVAFLVALASLRNFPIYVLDELDAALDPENQKRCANLIRHVATDAQVIIVSHNVSFQAQADTRLNL